MRLIYFSPVRLASYFQRPHYFVHHFLQQAGGDVIWVEPYSTRLPHLHDIYRIRTKAAHSPQELPRVRCISITALPIEPLPIIRIANYILRRRACSQLEQFATESDLLTIGVGKPSELALYALARLKHESSFYDAMDDFPEFYSGISKRHMSRVEDRLLERVDLVFASGLAIQQRIAKVRRDVRLVHNACDTASIPCRQQQANEKAVIGYIGSIGHWFDWDLTIRIALARPDAEIRLIGPVFTPLPLSIPKNILFLGPKSHSEAVRSMAKFSVGLIPFKLNKLTAGVDPIKYYEYVCAGLPILSTSFGEMQWRGTNEGVFKISDNTDLCSVIGEAEHYRFSNAYIRIFRKNNDWYSRWAECQKMGVK